MKVTAAAARRFVANPGADCRAVLLYGPNRALVADAAAALVRLALGGADDPFALTRLGEDDIRKDKARLSDALAAQSLLGGANCVWLKIEGETTSDTILAAVKEIEAGAQRAFFIVEAGEIASKGRLVKAFEDGGATAAIAYYEESDAERHAALRTLLQDRGVSMTPDAQALFLAEAPVDRAAARGEVEKLALYGHGLGRQISFEDVAALSIAAEAPELDEAVRAAASGKRAVALEQLDRADAAAVFAIRSLQRRIGRLMEARLLVEGGVPVGDAGDRLKPKVFWKDRDTFAAQLRIWSLERLAKAQEILWRAEVRAKTASAVADPVTITAFSKVADLAKPDRA